jgi:methoxymalonate biosynthesis acyl carrier protein
MFGKPHVEERLAQLFQASLNLDVPTIDTDLFETGVLDSLAFVELLLMLEREFGVTTAVDDLEVDNFRTIGRIAAFVGERTAPTGRVVLMRARA